MMKPLFLITASVLLSACNPQLPTPMNTLAEPPTVGFDANNQPATEHLRGALSRTGQVACVENNQEYPLTSAETEELLELLAGVQSSTPLCAPADCFYLNLQMTDGSWLMSLPVQKTPEGIVLLYLKLQGNNAGEPLQGWWKSVAARLGI